MGSSAPPGSARTLRQGPRKPMTSSAQLAALAPEPWWILVDGEIIGKSMGNPLENPWELHGQWIGLRENLQETPIFNGKNHGSCRFSLNPITGHGKCHFSEICLEHIRRNFAKRWLNRDLLVRKCERHLENHGAQSCVNHSICGQQADNSC